MVSDSKHPASKRLKFDGASGSVLKVRKSGQRQFFLDDLYHRVLSMPWWRFFSSVTVVWIGANFLFACLYAASPDCVANASTFEELFYFSVQTFATIGYGGMYPATRYGHLVVVVEALVGTLGMALVLGVTFSKFARATARVIFSQKAVVSLRDGVPYLIFRMANWRGNMVVEGQLRVIVLLKETSREGEVMRVPRELPLVRDRTALFALTWVPMHRIDPSSPFWGGQDAIDRLRGSEATLYLAFTGLDETIGQTIHARHGYRLEDIVWNARHADVLTIEPDGTRIVDYAQFHDVEVLGEPSEISWVAQ